MSRKNYERYFGPDYNAATWGADPYTAGSAFTIPTGVTTKVFAIDFPHEGKLCKLTVAQLTGTKETFDVTVYNRNPANITKPAASYSQVMANAKVMPTNVGNAYSAGVYATTASGAAYEFFDSHGYNYRNMEGTFAVPVRKLYLQITLGGDAGGSTWEVSIGCEPVQGA